MESVKISELEQYNGSASDFEVPGVADGETQKANLGAMIEQGAGAAGFLKPDDLKTINGQSVAGSGDLNVAVMNPLKGTYLDTDTLPRTGQDGDYIYVVNTSVTPRTANVYAWNGAAFADTGKSVENFGMQFATGQAVNDVEIKDLDGNNDQNAAGILSASAGASLKDKVFLDTYKSTIINLSDYNRLLGYIYRVNETWVDSNTNNHCYLIPVSDLNGDQLIVESTGEGDYSCQIAWLANSNLENNTTPPYATGTQLIILAGGTEQEITIPNDAQFLYVLDSVNLPIITKKDRESVKSKLAEVQQTVNALENSLIITAKLKLDEYESQDGYIGPGGNNRPDVFDSSSSRHHKLIPVSDLNQWGNIVRIVSDGENACTIAWLTGILDGRVVPFCIQPYHPDSKRIIIPLGESREYEIPSNAQYLYLLDNPGALPTIYYSVNSIDNFDERIVEIEEKLEPSTDIVSLNDKDLTKRYLTNLKRPSYTGGSYTALPSPIVLLHFSDLHSDAVNLTRIVEYATTYANYIDDVIGTGDIIRNEFTDSFDFWHECGADSFLLSTGNHEYFLETDRASNTYYQNVTPLQVYNKFFAQYRSGWGDVVFPTDAAEAGKCYYYKDYINYSGSGDMPHGIRLIVLDCMANMNPSERDNTGVQAAWLEGVLEDAKTNKLHVLCAIHIGTTLETLFETPFSSFATVLNSDSGVGSRAYTEFYSLRDKVEAFITDGGVFIGWIAGHRHSDSIGMITGYNQMSIHVATASGGEYSSSDTGHGDTDANNNGHCWWIVPRGDDCDRADGTRGQDCFNIISIDTEKMMFRVFKVGSNIDRYGRRKDSLVYNYGTRQLIYSDGCSVAQTIQTNN